MLFSDVVGQDSIKSHLLSAARSARVPHALLFAGAVGTGTLAMAIAFAQYLNCEKPGENDSCGECNSCNKYSKLIHPDLHFSYPVISADKNPGKSINYITEWREAVLANPYLSYQQWMMNIAQENKQGNITQAECQDIINKLSFKTFEGKFKVLIMWMPELLRETGNTLLKLIEEPPPDTLFILVANEREAILQTILSRTQSVLFPRLEDNEIKSALIHNYQIAAEEASTIAHMADGNYNAALSALEETDNIQQEIFRDWMRKCLKINRELPDLMKTIDELAALGREKQKGLISYGLYMIRSSVLNNHHAFDHSTVDEPESKFVNGFCKVINDKNMFDLTQHFNEAHYEIERNCNAKITLLNLSLRCGELFARN